MFCDNLIGRVLGHDIYADFIEYKKENKYFARVKIVVGEGSYIKTGTIEGGKSKAEYAKFITDLAEQLLKSISQIYVEEEWFECESKN